MTEFKFRTMDVYDVIAFIGGFILASAPYFQIKKIIKTRHTSDVSMSWSLAYIIGLTMVTLYSIRHDLVPIYVGEIIEFCGICIIIGFKITLEKQFLRWKWGKPRVNEYEGGYQSFTFLKESNQLIIYLDNEDTSGLDEHLDNCTDRSKMKFTFERDDE